MSEEVAQFRWYLSFLSEYYYTGRSFWGVQISPKKILMISKRYLINEYSVIELKTYKSKCDYFEQLHAHQSFMKMHRVIKSEFEEELIDYLEDELYDDLCSQTGYRTITEESKDLNISHIWGIGDTKG